MLKHVNKGIKCWTFSGDKADRVDIRKIAGNLQLEEQSAEGMLGIMWNPAHDVFKFAVRINLPTLKRKTRTGLVDKYHTF